MFLSFYGLGPLASPNAELTSATINPWMGNRSPARPAAVKDSTTHNNVNRNT